MSDMAPITREEYEQNSSQVWDAIRTLTGDVKSIATDVRTLIAKSGASGRVSMTTILSVAGLLIAFLPIVLSLIGGAAAATMYMVSAVQAEAREAAIRNEQRIERLENGQHERDMAQDSAQRDERLRNDRIERDAGGMDMFIRLWMNGNLRMESP
jgi:hypothetical protein